MRPIDPGTGNPTNAICDISRHEIVETYDRVKVDLLNMDEAVPAVLGCVEPVPRARHDRAKVRAIGRDIQARNPDRGPIERERKPARRAHADPDPSEVAGSNAHADRREVTPGNFVRDEEFLEHIKEPLGLAFGQGLAPRRN